MRSRKTMIFCVSLLFMLGGVASAANSIWSGSVDCSWTNSSNWDTAPVAGSGVWIDNMGNGNHPVVNADIIDTYVDILIGVFSNTEAVLTIENGGHLRSSSDVFVCWNGNSSSQGRVEMTGGTLTGYDLRVGADGTGTFNMSGGTIDMSHNFIMGQDDGHGVGEFNISGGNVNFGVWMGAGYQSGGMNTINVTGTGYLEAENLSIGLNDGDGSLTLSDSGHIKLRATSSRLRVGEGSAATGAINMNGGMLEVGSYISLGHTAGGAGSMTMTNGDVRTSAFVVGLNGAGDFTMSGGNLVLRSHVRVGEDEGEGVWNMQGGLVESTNYIAVGWGATDAGEMNIINMSGGELYTGDLQIGAVGDGIVNLCGGEINVNFFGSGMYTNGLRFDTHGGVGKLNLAGGTLNWLHGDYSSVVNAFINSGNIIAYDGDAEKSVDVFYDSDSDTTVVTAIDATWTGSVDFVDCPSYMQLYPRDRTTDTAVVAIRGVVTNAAADSIILRVYCDDILSSATTQTLVFANNSAPFSFEPVIAAEMKNYGFKVLILNEGVETLVRWVENVVAGDVFIIQGQSNADAAMYTGSASENENPFIRTFGMNGDRAITETDLRWKAATGDGSRNVEGGVGQWGLRMGRLLIDAYAIPIAILNGAHGGQPIGFFQRNDINHADLDSNYGRLLYRARLAGVAHKVRSILWYQGESDDGDGETHEAGVIALREDWKEDYPEIERIYIHQLRVGCLVDKEDVDLRNRQRLLPDRFPDMSVMSTTGIDGHEGCHYAYEKGYKLIGNHIAGRLAVDLYGSTNTANTTAPNISHIYFSTPAFDEITMVMREPADRLGFDVGATNDFILQGSSVTVTNGAISSNNNIVLSLSGDASGAEGLAYTGHSYGGDWVTNAAGLGLLTFFSAINSTDQDGDGLPNSWELLYFGNITNAVADSICSNGVNTVLEAYIGGLDPNDPDSNFLGSILPGNILQWNTVSGRVYSVYCSTNLLNGFQILETNIPWTAEAFTDSVHSANIQMFYRIGVELDR